MPVFYAPAGIDRVDLLPNVELARRQRSQLGRAARKSRAYAALQSTPSLRDFFQTRESGRASLTMPPLAALPSAQVLHSVPLRIHATGAAIHAVSPAPRDDLAQPPGGVECIGRRRKMRARLQ